MKGFNYFEKWLIERRDGILRELEQEFLAYSDQLQLERRGRIQLETELRKLKTGDGGNNNDHQVVGDGAYHEGRRGSDVDVGGVTQRKTVREAGIEGQGGGPSTSRRGTLGQEAIDPGVGEDTAPKLVTSHSNGSTGKRISTLVVSPPPTKPKRPRLIGPRSIRNCLEAPLPLYEPYSKKLDQLWTLITDSSQPNCGAATRNRSIKLVAEVPIPFGRQQELVRFICGIAAVHGKDGNYGQSLHCFRLLESLLDNPTMDYDDNADHMRETIDELFPAIVKRLQLKPTSKRDWELLHLTSSLLGKLTRMWGTVRESIAHLFSFRLSQVLTFYHGRSLPLMTLYTVIFTVKEMGKKYVQTLILSNMRGIGERLRLAMGERDQSEFPEFDKVAIQRIKTLILETVSPILELTRTLPDPLRGYEEEFGHYFGGRLFHFVRYLREQKERK